MQELTSETIPPLSERIITIGSDRLLPKELSGAELILLLDTVTSVLPEANGDNWLEQSYAYHKSMYDKITALNETHQGVLIPLNELRPPGLSQLLKEDIHVFDIQEDIYVTLHQVIDAEANTTLPEWKERFQEINHRQPSEHEVEAHLYPGYQLVVHSDNEELKIILSVKLETQGFPVSLYLGLEKDDVPEEEKKDQSIYLGKKDGKFRKQFEVYLSQFTGDLIKEMQNEGKIDETLEQILLTNFQAREAYVYELTLTQFVEGIKSNPILKDTPIDDGLIKLNLKLQLMREKM